ncbi:MAG TPA: L-lactate dehydrogenase [Firmicutes bacterium]|nr:L-lactate dehydrogenase [Bacillota bacterium]
MVGSSFAYALMISGLVSEIVILDVNKDRLEGEVMDLNHGMPFVRPAIIRSGDYADLKGADLVVITAGVAQKVGETRLELVHRNVAVFREIIPKVAENAAGAVLLVATNPVDVMTYVTYRLSGFDKRRVIGSGTVLDTARFRYLLSDHCQIDPANVHAYVLGEHGDSEVPIWSLANIAGVRFTDYCPVCGRDCGPIKKQEIFEEVKNAAYKVIKGKGATYYGIGLAMVNIAESILRDEYSVLTVSSLMEGEYGLEDLCLSLPTVVARQGVVKKLRLELTPEEEGLLRRSGEVVREVLSEVGF